LLSLRETPFFGAISCPIRGVCRNTPGGDLEGFRLLMLYPCGVGKPRLSLSMTVFIMDSGDIPVTRALRVIDFIKDFQLKCSK
jgi:hypothetical protein